MILNKNETVQLDVLMVTPKLSMKHQMTCLKCTGDNN